MTVLLNGCSGEAYNICTDEVMMIRQMAEIYAQVGNVELSYAQATEREANAFNPMDNSSLSFNKLEELGFKPFFKVEEGLKHTVQILREMQEME